MATPDDPDALRWVAELAAALDIEAPSGAEIDDLLSLAGTAAHASERWVAPISTWLVARGGLDPVEARALVERLADGRRPHT